MTRYETRAPQTPEELASCHEIREYVLRESFADEGISFNHYNSEHPVHKSPNQSLIFFVDGIVRGSVRMDKEFEHLKFQEGDIRLALFGISPDCQNQGLGKLFFQGVLKWCQVNKINTIYTNSRISSHSFWQKMGFQDEVWDKGLDCKSEIQMIFRIASH